jgi:hypothetical protein
MRISRGRQPRESFHSILRDPSGSRPAIQEIYWKIEEKLKNNQRFFLYWRWEDPSKENIILQKSEHVENRIGHQSVSRKQFQYIVSSFNAQVIVVIASFCSLSDYLDSHL